MPDLDRVFAPARPNTPPAFSTSQAWEARVSKVTQRGAFVVIPGYDRHLEWGPCLPPGASVNVGETVTVAMTNRGRPWLLGAGGGRSGVDVGDVKATARETPPPGWLLCHGQAVGRAEYADLFDAIGLRYTYGGDDGATFNVPELRDRMALGASASRPLGYRGGAETVALSIAEMPSHSHAGATTGTDRSIDHLHTGVTAAADRSLEHAHHVRTDFGPVQWLPDQAFSVYTQPGYVAMQFANGVWGTSGIDRNIDHLHGFTTNGADRSLDHLHYVHADGGGGGHQNMSPFTAVNYVIKF